MTHPFYRSTAQLVFVQGVHLQDLQLLIDDPDLYNQLPGKLERHGVKTLSAFPFFVTAILNEASHPYPDHMPEQAQAEIAIRESLTSECQLPIFDQTTTARPSGQKARKRKIDKTLAEIRRLHDELNAQLYAMPKERPSIQSPNDAFQVLHSFLSPLDHEELWVVGLDTRNRVMSLTKLYQGSVNSSQVRVGEVFRQAIIDNSPSILLAHNHPSGDPSPSPDDVTVTRGIVQAGKLLDICVMDHLVIGGARFVSLKERGLGFS